MPNENLGFVSRWTFGDCNDVEAKRLLLHKCGDPEYLSIWTILHETKGNMREYVLQYQFGFMLTMNHFFKGFDKALFGFSLGWYLNELLMRGLVDQQLKCLAQQRALRYGCVALIILSRFHGSRSHLLSSQITSAASIHLPPL
jgi:hypothetical protein